MRTAVPIVVLAGCCFAVALLAADNRSLDELADTVWKLTHVGSSQGWMDAEEIELTLSFPDDGSERFVLTTRCGETEVFYTPNGLGGDVTGAHWHPSGACPTIIRLNPWTSGTRFWLQTAEDSLTFEAEFAPEAKTLENLRHRYTLESSASAG
jgi:hypothetical protein